MMRLVRDGAPGPLAAPGLLPLPGRPRRGRPFRVLVLGGARSGKSVTAERMLGGRDHVDYVACGLPADDSDPSWAERVRLHQERRPAHWATRETLDLEGVLGGADRGAGPCAGGLPVDLAGRGHGRMRSVDGHGRRGQGACRPDGRAARRLGLDQAARCRGEQRGGTRRGARDRLGGSLPRRARPAQRADRRPTRSRSGCAPPGIARRLR